MDAPVVEQLFHCALELAPGEALDQRSHDLRGVVLSLRLCDSGRPWRGEPVEAVEERLARGALAQLQVEQSGAAGGPASTGRNSPTSPRQAGSCQATHNSIWRAARISSGGSILRSIPAPSVFAFSALPRHLARNTSASG